MTVNVLAPSFSLPNQKGIEMSLDSLCEQGWLILYFYPKDNTSGCTSQALDFKEHHDKFLSKGCRVVGISKDSAKSHLNFIEKYELPFDLLVDETADVCTLFDVYKEKSMYGRKYMGIERSTFLISPDKELVKTWRKVKVPNHVQSVYEFLSNVNL